VRLEAQFGSQSVVVPQGGDVVLANGQLEGLRSNSALCACEAYAPQQARLSNSPEISVPATSEEVKKNAAASKDTVAPAPDPPPAAEPTYQVFMPPLRYDASQKVQDEPDPKLIVMVRRVRVRPTLIFASRVEGEAPATAAKSLTAEATKPTTNKPPTPASGSLVDRVKSFLKSLWTPSS